MKIVFAGVKSPHLLQLANFEAGGHQSFESSSLLARLAAGWPVPGRKPAGKGHVFLSTLFPLEVERNIQNPANSPFSTT